VLQPSANELQKPNADGALAPSDSLAATQELLDYLILSGQLQSEEEAFTSSAVNMLDVICFEWHARHSPPLALLLRQCCRSFKSSNSVSPLRARLCDGHVALPPLRTSAIIRFEANMRRTILSGAAAFEVVPGTSASARVFVRSARRTTKSKRNK
jgi:hypothetical protein